MREFRCFAGKLIGSNSARASFRRLARFLLSSLRLEVAHLLFPMSDDLWRLRLPCFSKHEPGKRKSGC